MANITKQTTQIHKTLYYQIYKNTWIFLFSQKYPISLLLLTNIPISLQTLPGPYKVDKVKLFVLAEYTATRSHSLKLFKRRSRLHIRANSFSNRVVDVWNSLHESVVQAPSLNHLRFLKVRHSMLHSWPNYQKPISKMQKRLMYDAYYR